MKKLWLLIVSALIISQIYGNDTEIFVLKDQKPIQDIKQEVALIQKEEQKIPQDMNNKEWVKNKLATMVKVDQLIRSYIDPKKQPNKELIRLWKKIDKEHSKELKKILKKYDWIKISEFGKEADNNAWTLVQHADLKFQKKIIKRLEQLYPLGETAPQNFAYLYDRVAVRSHKPQRYGTQGTVNAKNEWQSYDIEESEKLDERRKEMGLPPYKEYVEQINKVYELNQK